MLSRRTTLTAASLFAVWAATPTPAAAQQRQERLSGLYAVRVQLQQGIQANLQETLDRIAAPYDILVAVEVVVGGKIAEVTTKDVAGGVELNMGGEETVKLPGLPRATGRGSVPKVSVKVPQHERQLQMRELESWVERITVRLFVSKGMPEEQLQQIKQAATDLGGLDLSRGDKLDVIPVSSSDRLKPRSDASIVPWIVAGAFVLSALILALGLARRRAAAAGASHTTVTTMSGGGGAEGAAGEGGTGDLGPAGGNGAVAGVAHGADGEPRAFGFLRELPNDHLLEVLSALEPTSLAVVLDQLSLGDQVVRELFSGLDVAKRRAIIKSLGRRDVIPMDDVHKMEESAKAEREKVEARLKVGSSVKAADTVSVLPEEDMREILDQLEKEDAKLAEEIRSKLFMFDDLSGAPVDAIRAVVTSLDPNVTALAILGAPQPIRDAVLGAVSKRLRTILETEGELLGERSEADIAAARDKVVRAMRRHRSM